MLYFTGNTEMTCSNIEADKGSMLMIRQNMQIINILILNLEPTKTENFAFQTITF